MDQPTCDRVSFINVSSVKRTDVGESNISLQAKTHCSRWTPESQLISPILNTKTQTYSCTGGIL